MMWSIGLLYFVCSKLKIFRRYVQELLALYFFEFITYLLKFYTLASSFDDHNTHVQFHLLFRTTVDSLITRICPVYWQMTGSD